jgi:hypothetical protein
MIPQMGDGFNFLYPWWYFEGELVWQERKTENLLTFHECCDMIHVTIDNALIVNNS